MVTYNARFERDPDNGGYTVTLPDFGWGVTQGDNLADAEKWAGRLLHDMIAHLIKNNEAIPEPRAKGRGLRAVTLDSLAQAKVECYLAFRASGMRKSELARRMGIPKTSIDRLFDLDHASRLDQIDVALHALGKRLIVAVEDAA
ncbi:MAG TPA: type II toxin-antitoxin system HicB family antitoxin [Bryobacteraceae bacterium]|nr:type II toxin-antitoxin system HicB family antitoxin [Bryobacteraceae bacterium]